MLRIKKIEDFTDYLQKNLPPVDKHCCLRHEDNRKMLTKIFCELFDKLEKNPVTFSEKKEEMIVIKEHYSKYIQAGEIFLEYLESGDFRQPFLGLELVLQRIIGLNYRIQKLHGGMDQDENIDQPLFQSLLNLVEVFKRNQKLYESTVATKKDCEKMMEVSRYFTFGKFILKFPNMRDKFFKWALRDNNSVATFIEFPATSERLIKSFIDKRVGYFNPKELEIIFEDQQKVLKLPFYDGEKVNRINILDESKIIILNHDRRITIKEIFDIFAQKKIDPGSVEYFGVNGIMNWGSYEFGPYNEKTKTYDRIDFTKEKWWELLPIFEMIPRQNLEKRYQIAIQKNDWIQTIASTREAKNFDLLKRHGFYEIAIPMENDQYHLFPFGKYPAEFPTRILDQLKIVSKTVIAKMQFPDENKFYSQRQHASHSCVIDKAAGLQKMEKIKDNVILALNNNLTFHFGGPNCAFFADDVAGTTCFDMPFSEMQPSNPAQEFFLRCPRIFQPYVATFLQWLANTNGVTVIENGEHVYKTTLFGKNFREAEQSQPARLFQQIEEKKLPGVITFGRG